MIRLLFADDEPRVLDGLRRSLRSERGRWEMTFAPGGAEAIAALDAGPFDVVVSDMRMPQVDGVAVLEHARTVRPEAIRIVLSGFSELSSTIRAVSVAHQFLSKPCEGEHLRATIDRALALRVLLSNDELRRRVGLVAKLPAVPRVYSELGRVVADENSTMGDVAEVVGSDPGVSARILHVANSAFFGPSAKVETIENAVGQLGTETVRSLVLAAEVFGGDNLPEGTTDAWLLAQREHALAAASLARQIVPDRAKRDQAFLAGLLHDIGELITPTRRAAAGAEPAAVSCGGSHAELGAYLLGLWGLPDLIVEAVAMHHHPGKVEGGPGLEVLAAVHATEALLAEVAGPDASADVIESSLDEAWLARVGFADKIEDWRALAQAAVRGEP